MDRLMFVFVTVIPVISDGLTVRSPSGPVVAPLGSSVILPCYVDGPLLMEDLEVEWRRRDSETLVHLFQDGESRPEAQQQDYQDRAHFFTEHIKDGNFSLRLDNLRAEDEGEYTCTVHHQQESGETVVEIKVDNVERLLVSGSDRSISASVGEDVTLNCSVDSHITPEDFEQVSWKKTDEDEEILVLLYQDNEALPEASHERYRDRVEFFTAEIPKGNFSVRLKSVRTEDKGVYMCQVFAGGASANATVALERLGFSALHIIMMILCVSASGSALLLCCLIYCRSSTKGLIVQNTLSGNFLGGSVVLPCHVPPNLLTDDLKVEWRRTDSGTLVHLYEDGESRAEKQQQDYQDRAHFFTDHIKHGNFSLRLDNLRAEDKGEYTCTVYSKRDCVFSAKTNLDLKFDMSGKLIPLGGSVILPCQVDKSLLQESLKVEWRRTDSDTLVHLYEDGESRAEEQHKDYHKRAQFSNKKIEDGNFSLCLKKLRAEDEGVYRCKVYKDQDCVFSTDAELKLGLTVEPSHHTTVPLGSSVVLPCYDDRLSTMNGLKVEWRKKDLKDLVHLYEDGESRAEKQHKDYHDRAHFFTDQIQHRNFSLRLDNLRAEDEGEYTCTVHSGLSWNRREFSTKIKLVLKLLDTVFRLQMFLVFCPNILMFLSFVLWGVSEGSLFESVSCCALYFLRPLMLLWAAPYINNFTGNIKTWIENYSFRTEYIVFSAVFYSVLFKSAWDKSLNYAGFEGVMIIVMFVMVLLFNLFYIIFLLMRLIGKLSQRIITIFRVLAGISFDVLPSLQFILLFYAFGAATGGFIIIAVLPVFLTVTRYNWDFTCGEQMGCSPSVRRSVYLTVMLLVNAVLVYFYIITLENEKDRVGWACMIAFLQLLWAVMNFTWSFEYDLLRLVPVYVFGSVGVVLLNSVALMTELILKTVNGEGAVGDLRIIVFSSEFIFTLFLLVLMIFEPWIKPCLESCQKAIKSRRTAAAGSQNQESQNAAGSDETPAAGSNQNQNTAESHEMNPLLNQQNQETQPDSVVSQT
ncbi:uncharacterized protein LOC127509873 [Ctenopharyngodon idella]|uniref:uncharacterized protein LOC127509873 n=1 Tax=Ctenopharyngodon idella TaxID=7959 RepID=UPI00222F1D82|nr:uncharacterized protein LOC127509873 [Ctenopharyngodon idella]